MKSIFDKKHEPTAADYEKLDGTSPEHIRAIIEMKGIVKETMAAISSSEEKTKIMYQFAKHGFINRESKKFFYEPMFAYILHDRYNFTKEKCTDLMLNGKALETCYDLYQKEKASTVSGSQTKH